MFKPSQLLIEALIQRSTRKFVDHFVEIPPGYRQCLVQTMRMALQRMSLTNAMYTNLETAMNTIQVSENVLIGRSIARGDVDVDDWLHFITAASCFVIGFVRHLLPGDEGRTCVVDAAGTTIDFSGSKTDGGMYLYATERAKLFVRNRFASHPIIDGNRVAAMIDYTHYPPLPNGPNEPGSWGSLLRGAQTIAVVSDPRFRQRLKYLYMELEEVGIAQRIGYKSAADMRSAFPKSFWALLFPQAREAVNCLKYTEEGLYWLANMNSHMLQEEHRNHPMGHTA